MRALLVASILLLASLGSATASHPQDAGARTTSFDHKTGNDWWVEVIVTGSPSGVEARDDGGAWIPLELKSWGAWGASFRIESGHRVQFRASWSDGALVESCWFTHPEGVEQCEGTPPPPPPTGEFTFDHGGGNEWWVEVKVDPRPESVQAMDTGGSWVALELKSWGEWAGSFRIEPGNQVKFRALADGTWHESCWFTHPEGAPQCDATPPPPPSESAYAFDHAGGNNWWVEVEVNPKPQAVQAMDTGGSWVALSFKSWGEWAGSFRIEPGHEVRFRAKGADGVWHESCWFSHPAGVERPCGEDVWPREGSYVRYFVDEGEHWPSGADWHELNVTLRYIDGAWQQEVEGWNYFELYDDRATQTRIQYVAASQGPRYSDPPADADETSYSTKKDGESVEAPALRWSGENDPDCPCGSWTETAHDGTDLLLSYRTVGRMSHSFTDVVDTDAPIAPGDPEPTPPPAPAWPAEGSYVRYSVHEWSRAEWEPYDLYYNATFLYEDGAWSLHCVGTRYNHEGESQNASVQPYEGSSQWSAPHPPLAPTAITNGTVIQFERLSNCHTWTTSQYGETVVAKSWLTVRTNQSGEPFTARTWYADENATQEAEGDDFDAWWDVDTRLVLRWEHIPRTTYGRSMGNMTDTDAPLRRA